MVHKLLYQILAESTRQFRKTEAVVHDESGAIPVTTIDFNAPVSDLPQGWISVDLDLLVIGVDQEKANQWKDSLINILNNWPNDTLKDGPSYISVGADIGDQGTAFQLFALGKVLGLWEVITPGTFGMVGEQARIAAGNGFIMITGYRK